MKKRKVFISYCGQDQFEANILKFAIEEILKDVGVVAWTFQHDQSLSEREIAQSIKKEMKESDAVIFFVSPITLKRGATQWMELAYADAFEVRTFVLLHHLTYADLKSSDSVTPLLLAGQCNASIEWRAVIESIRVHLKEPK